MAETIESGPLDPSAPKSRRPRRVGNPLLFMVLGVALAAALAVVLFVGIGTSTGPSPVAPGIDGASANLLQLDVFGSGGGPPAPNFTLTDQFGRTVSLRGFRGKSVVLSFNDDQCTDICTLLAQDVVMADRDLGPAARDVVFLSVNANPYYPAVATVRGWSDQHGLAHVANWVFTTGTPSQLAAVWKHYGVEVELDPATRTVVHSTELYFIGPAGRQLAIGSFGTASADTSFYSHALAQMADDDLPATEQVQVAGPSAVAPGQAAIAIGARVPAFSLPRLGSPGSLSSGSLRGRYSVVNFWSSTCPPCLRELPALELAHRDLGTKVNFVGVDESDIRSTAERFAGRAGVTYPLVTDASGAVASSYQIPALPFTAILSPRGVLETLHPGALTTEQLVYVLENLDPALRSG